MKRLIYQQDVLRKQIVPVICGSSATGGPQLNLSTIFSLAFLGSGFFVDVLACTATLLCRSRLWLCQTD